MFVNWVENKLKLFFWKLQHFSSFMVVINSPCPVAIHSQRHSIKNHAMKFSFNDVIS